LAKDNPKPTRKPRPPKAPAVPLRQDQSPRPEVGLVRQKLIGRVVIEWSKLENTLQELLWWFLEINFEDGRVITEKMDVSRLFGILRTMAPRKLKGDVLTELLNLLQIADELREDRNFIIHGAWATLEPDGVAVAASLRPKSDTGQVVQEHFPHDRMHHIVNKILKTKVGIFRIIESLTGPSPYR
jgi:hypothetical protein